MNVHAVITQAMLCIPKLHLQQFMGIFYLDKWFPLCSVLGRELVLEIRKHESIELKCPGHTAQKRQGKL